MVMDNENSEQAQERRQKPLNDLLTPAMVHIYVGSENTHWYIHERLLCYYSPFFSDIFYADDKDPERAKAQRNKAYGLPEEEDLAFEMLVGWLYSRHIKVPTEEKDVGPLLDLYLLSEKLRMEKLSNELVEAISDYYYQSQSYPSLRRVQHIYANTDDDNAMREMMVGAVAKLLTTSEKIPVHWASALQRNGQLAVDIIRSIQLWKIEENTIPDARDRSSSRGRSAKGGFSTIDREGTESMETDKTGITSNLGVESLNSDAEGDHTMADSKELKSITGEAPTSIPTSNAPSFPLSPPPNYSTVTSPPPLFTSPAVQAEQWKSPSITHTLSKPEKPPDLALQSSPSSPSPQTVTHLAFRNKPSPPLSSSLSSTPSKRHLSVTFSDQVSYNTYTFFPPGFAGSQDLTPSLLEEQSEDKPQQNQDQDQEHNNQNAHNEQRDGTTRSEGLGINQINEIEDLSTPSQLTQHKKNQKRRNDKDKIHAGEEVEIHTDVAGEGQSGRGVDVKRLQQQNHVNASPEAVMLGFLWMLYLSWLAKFN